MVSTSKTRHYSRASSVLTDFLFLCAANNRANLVFKTTIIEDTHLTLAGIPFNVETNNSLILLPLQIYKKKISRVSVPVYIYNSLVTVVGDVHVA